MADDHDRATSCDRCPLLIAVAYLTYAERKVIAAMQLRKGPNVVGPFGLLQPLADALKLMLKETIIPTGANRVVFLMAPMLTFVLAPGCWAVIPFVRLGAADINVGVLYSVRDLVARCLWHHHGGLGLELEYTLPRRVAVAAQMVSYEVSIGFVIITVLLRRIAEPVRYCSKPSWTCWFVIPVLRCS